MSLNTSHTVKCEKCSKVVSVAGANATRGDLYKKATSAGWQWKSAKLQYCPDHKTVVSNGKPKKPAKAAPKKASKPKKATAPTLPKLPEVLGENNG